MQLITTPTSPQALIWFQRIGTIVLIGWWLVEIALIAYEHSVDHPSERVQNGLKFMQEMEDATLGAFSIPIVLFFAYYILPMLWKLLAPSGLMENANTLISNLNSLATNKVETTFSRVFTSLFPGTKSGKTPRKTPARIR